jgi:hypothetical protein
LEFERELTRAKYHPGEEVMRNAVRNTAIIIHQEMKMKTAWAIWTPSLIFCKLSIDKTLSILSVREEKSKF